MPSSPRASASLNIPRRATSTPARWLSLGAAAVLTLVLCASTASALPTNQRRAALAEPLFARASSQLGPDEPLERLRQRRNAAAANLALADRQRAARPNSNSIIVERSTTPKHAIPNPKSAPKGSAFAKRAPEPRTMINPKACSERPALAAQTSGSRRSFMSFVRRFLGNPVEKRSPLAFRDFTKPRTIPNPKSPTFAKTSTSTTTTIKSATPRTTTPAKTTTTKAATTKATTKSTTTTTKATTTAKVTTVPPAATTSSSSWPVADSMIAGAYYPDWQGDTLPPANINYHMFDLIHFGKSSFIEPPFAVPYVISSDNYGVKFSQWNSETLLSELITRGHANGTKVVISIGGWTDSGKFSYAVSTRTRRNNFVKNIAAMVARTGADGVDIDWEYPGTQGASGNAVSSSDTDNFLLFLQDLRRVLPTARLSSCTTQQAFIGANGSPLANVSAFAQVLDGILVMNYDVWGASSNPGPNAPLENSCANSNQPFANMNSAIQSWTLAGMPASKILMGVPGYGYVSGSTKTTLVNKRTFEDLSSEDASRELLQEAGARRNADDETRRMSVFHRSYLEGQEKAMRRRRKAKRAARGGDVFALGSTGSDVVKVVTKNNETIIFCPGDHSGKPCQGVKGQNISSINWNPLNGTKNGTSGTNGTESGGVFTGNVGHTKLGKGDLTGLDGNQIAFWELINYGVIVQKNGAYVGTNGYTRAWDKCSSTPYLYDVKRKTVITYDDPQSLQLKGVLARQKGIQGTLMWEMSEDTVDFQLTQAFQSGMGLRATG
ncbi:BQ2448_3480 [Microbotryum intermedium]|uniref:BQ2448_3480 protein n=1 Tax=Microbotryum intermedium TaxID=269621 RepID=A0A238FHS9_9BASI|nr:BQ2448_3480 [Microbotryum intermedium]